MNLKQSILLGLLQGVAEFLPISSSGHIELLKGAMGLEGVPLLLETFLHLGTLLVICVMYCKRIFRMLRHPIKSDLKWLIVATLPTVAAVLLLGDALDALFGGWHLGVCFLITCVVLLVGEAGHMMHDEKHKKVNCFDALAMGLMQVLAIIPGVSRLGCTITGGLCTGLTRRRAVDFSFLMSIPAVLGSLALNLKDIYDQAQAAGTTFSFQFSQGIQALGGYTPVLVCVLTAAVVGFASISLCRLIIRKFGLKIFAFYTGALGLILIARQLLAG